MSRASSRNGRLNRAAQQGKQTVVKRTTNERLFFLTHRRRLTITNIIIIVGGISLSSLSYSYHVVLCRLTQNEGVIRLNQETFNNNHQKTLRNSIVDDDDRRGEITRRIDKIRTEDCRIKLK